MSLDDLTIREFLSSLAAKTPTPGGGAVAGLLAAVSASLAQMVVNYSIGKNKLAEHDDLHQRAMTQLTQLSERAIALATADATAYANLNSLLKLERNDAKRTGELAQAVDEANAPAWQVMQTCGDAVTLLRELCGRSNALLRSDLAIAAILAQAAARAAQWNINVNLPLIEDEDRRIEYAKRAAVMVEEVQTLASEIEAACQGDQ
jgi:glutamate formiminotransferase/formiminotetrahydrofolate cyclodeaminase